MICAVVKGPDLKAIYQQIESVKDHADLIELRLDLFENVSHESLRKLRADCNLPMIFTLRSKEQGGAFHHPKEEFIKQIRLLLDLNPEYLDVESHLPLSFFEEIRNGYPKIKVICSYHDFKETPEDLEVLFEELKEKPAFFYKIALMANSSIDAMRFLCWAKQKDRRLIAVSMGAFGQISRVLAPVIGSPLTYASVSEELESAPGQITAETLVKLYRYCSLNPKTKIYGLIGGVVETSMSHETHNALIKKEGLDAVYIKLSVQQDQIGEFLKFAKQLPFCGISVTMPLKENVIHHLDNIDPVAEVIGAVNTLVFEEGKITGFNTDGIGALEAIERSFSIKDKTVVILGAGGAAKAVAYEACKRGAKVVILNRHEEKAVLLAKLLGCVGKGFDKMEQCFDEGYDLLINCTPLEMPIDKKFILPSSVVMDIKSKPKMSLFLEEAQKKGCKLICGYEMFVEQAVGQFDIWFKGAISPEKSRDAIERKVLELLR